MNSTNCKHLSAECRMHSYEDAFSFNHISSLFDTLEGIVLHKHLNQPLSTLLEYLDEDLQSEHLNTDMLKLAISNAVHVYALENDNFLSLEVKQCFYDKERDIYHLVLAKEPNSTTGIVVCYDNGNTYICHFCLEHCLCHEEDVTEQLPVATLGECIDYLLFS